MINSHARPVPSCLTFFFLILFIYFKKITLKLFNYIKINIFYK